MAFGTAAGHGARSVASAGVSMVGYATFGGSGASFDISAWSASNDFGAKAGDLLVLMDRGWNGAGTYPTYALPSGFTELWTGTGYDASSGYHRYVISAKVLASGDLSGSKTGMSSDFGSKNGILFRRGAGFASFAHGTWSGQATSGNPSSQTITMVGRTKPAIALALAHGNPSTANPLVFSTDSPAFDFTRPSTGTYSMHIGCTIYEGTDTLANHTVDINDVGNMNVLTSGYLELS